MMDWAGWPRRLVFAALTGVMGCSGTEPSKTEAVATVIVGGAPSGPLVIGNTAQLSATAVNATGGTIPGTNFTWASSDPNLATVSSGGLVTATGAGSVTITAAAQGKTGTATIDVRAGAAIGPAGGVLSLLNGQVTLNIPAGASPQSVNLLVRPVPDPVQSPLVVPGTVIEIAPDGTSFQQPITLGIRFEPARIPAGLTEVSLQLYYLSNGAWIKMGNSTVATSTHVVTGLTYRTGTYAVASTPVDHVVLGGPTLDGALFVSQSGQLTAQAFDADQALLAGRAVVWSSSNPAAATVANGVVTAVAAGSASITATIEGKSTSTQILVLSRPTADWSQATEWVTHQGEPGHTGYVAATLDPVVFAERWVKTPVLGPGATPASLGPVTFSSGSVYGSSATYFGTQRAFALDLATGTERWSVSFGAIHGVHPPAYADGKVYLTTSGHSDSYLYALDAATGAQQFRSAYGNQWSVYYAPVIVGNKVYMAGGTVDGMYSFDGTDGTQLWFVATNQYNLWSPAVRGGKVYAYTGSYNPMVQVADAVTGTVTDTIADPHFSWNGWSMNTAPVLGGSNDLMATQAGRLVSFDLLAKNIRWEKAGQFTGTVAVAGGVVYVVNGDQLEARRESDGGLVWAWRASAALEPTTIITNNLVFAHSANATYAVDLSSHRQVWAYPAGGNLSLSAQGVLLIAGGDGKLTAVTVK